MDTRGGCGVGVEAELSSKWTEVTDCRELDKCRWS